MRPLKQTQRVYDCRRGKATKGNELFGLITEAFLTQTVSAAPDKRWPAVRKVFWAFDSFVKNVLLMIHFPTLFMFISLIRVLPSPVFLFPLLK